MIFSRIFSMNSDFRYLIFGNEVLKRSSQAKTHAYHKLVNYTLIYRTLFTV